MNIIKCIHCGIDKAKNPLMFDYPDAYISNICHKCRNKQKNASYHRLSPLRKKYRGIQANLKIRNLTLELTYTEFLDEIGGKLPTTCPICCIIMSTGQGIQSGKSFSVDRIDNNKGYIKGNIAIICLSCNYKKKDINIDFIKQLTKYLNK